MSVLPFSRPPPIVFKADFGGWLNWFQNRLGSALVLIIPPYEILVRLPHLPHSLPSITPGQEIANAYQKDEADEIEKSIVESHAASFFPYFSFQK
jgi:hypothetical protein